MIVPVLAQFHPVPVFGFYLPPLLLFAALALGPYLLARWVLARTGLYRFVWHRALFNLALYVLSLGAMVGLGIRAWL